MKNSIYPCAQSALYQVARNVYQSVSNHLIEFTNFKPKYTAAFITQAQAQITAAQQLPDFQARSAQAEVDYINLSANLQTCTILWQTLKRYIIASFSSDEQKPRLEEAGALYYERAMNKNWDAASSLLTSASNFLTLHGNGALSSGQNMPPTFPADFQSQIDQFFTALTTFQQAEEEIKIGTENKIITNNDIYKTVIEICLDGQIIFKFREALKDQFIFASILQLVSGTGTTGFKGQVINAATNLPILGATIVTSPPTKSVVTDADGYYELTQIASGTYTVLISAAGFMPQSINGYQVDSGITHILSIPMQPQP